MQHKRGHGRERNTRAKVIITLVAMVIISIFALLMRDIPAPQAPVEKELDAKALLTPGQQ